MLTHRVIGRAMRVQSTLGPGYSENVYKRALQLELEEAGIRVEREVRLEVHYRDWIVGDYYADMLVEGCLIVEAKALRALMPEHEVQLVSYLTTVRIEDGLLLNFGAPRLQVRRKFRTLRRGEKPLQDDRMNGQE